ncbi:MAG: hypothetical protein LBB16_01075 [Puniceicoccales bacterium]|jgi:hypothetical protein|nr:hypothetical protein [Puniceicoccales bacterium]
MVKINAEASHKSENVLPAEAKLDYSEDVSNMHADIMEKVAVSREKTEKTLAQNIKLAKQMRDVLDKQQKVFTALGCKLGDKNPVVERLKDKLSGLDDLAKLSRDHEIRVCDSLGLTPEVGWERTLARLNKPANGKGTMGELSNLLLRDSKSEEPLATDYAEKEEDSILNSEKKSADGQNAETTVKAKKVVKRMKI